MDYKQSADEYDNLVQSFVIQQPEQKKEVVVEEGYPFIDVDFKSLKEINPDVIGWIRIPDTIINYPIMHGEDNDEYIRTTFEKKSLSAGSIFLDYRNDSHLNDLNSVIYGHNMRDGSMFAPLAKYLDQEFFNEHKYIEIYTPTSAKVYSIVSLYTSTYEDKAYTFSFKNRPQFVSWLDERVEQNRIESLKVNHDKNVIVLSTCHGRSGTEFRLLLFLQELTKDELKNF